MADVMFAYKYCQIVPKKLGPNGQWPPHNTSDPPRPPGEWQRGGSFSSGWRAWRSPEVKLTDRDVTARQAFSFVWCQLNQTYWVFRGDCTNAEQVAEAKARADKWSTLQCHPLQEDSPSRPGLWKLCDWSNTPQHTSRCPPDFDEFLPGNFFTSQNGDAPCHFVGHLSLMLALEAMCPRNVNNIPNQIDRVFYQNNQPIFIPARTYGGSPMNRLGMAQSAPL